MLNKRHIKLYQSIILLLFAITCNSQAKEPPLTHNLTAVKTQISATALKLQNMDEELTDIKAMKGQTIVINFWATWCPPCRREMTSLEKLYLETKDKDIVVLAVNIGEDIETVFSFINSIEPSPTFPILFDTDALIMEQWNVIGLPTTYVVNPRGMIAYKAIGGREFNHPDILEKVINLKKN